MSDEKKLEPDVEPEIKSQTETSEDVVEAEKASSEDAEVDSQEQPDSESSEIANTETGTEVKAAGSSGTSFFSVLVGLLSIIAILAVGVIGFFGYKQVQQMSDRLVSLEQQEQNNKSDTEQLAQAARKNFAQLQSQLQQSLDQQHSNAEQKFDQLSEQLAATGRQIQSVGGRHRSDWLLAEADYLVRIATNRLLLERDHVTALVLLLSADERIMQMDDPALQPIREVLSRDMAMLRLLKRADIAGLAIRISSLIPQLRELPVLSFQLPEETIDEIESGTAIADMGWQQSLKNTFKELSVKWFEVRDHGRPVKPLMAPETETILRTNMTLLLQTTQFAVLRQHSELYHHSLQQLKNWITEYCDTADPTVIAFLNEVDLLNAKAVRVELPKTLESRLILAREVEQRLQQSVISPVTVTTSGEQ